jgi:hypothetical protein
LHISDGLQEISTVVVVSLLGLRKNARYFLPFQNKYLSAVLGIVDIPVSSTFST